MPRAGNARPSCNVVQYCSTYLLLTMNMALRLAFQWRRGAITGVLLLNGLPNVIEPRHEFISVNLGLTFRSEGMQRPVSQFQVLKYPPSIPPRAVGIRCNIDSEFRGIRHYRIMRRGSIWSQAEVRLPYPNCPTTADRGLLGNVRSQHRSFIASSASPRLPAVAGDDPARELIGPIAI
jgi:hypothetical protein